MQQGGNPARFVPNQPQNQQHAAQNKCQATSMLSNTGAAASQPPPYPGTQTLPSMGHTFSQRPAPYSELQSNPSQYQTVYPVQGAPGTSRMQAPVNSPSLSPGAIAMQGGRPPLSPSSLVVPRKSLAGMISPIKQQSQPVNMLPPTSPMMLGGRLQMPVSPHGTYMSQPQSAQRMTAMSHVRNVSPRTYPPQSPVYRQNPASYNFVPQPIGTVPRSPVPSSLYVDPGQHHQLSPMIPRSPHHSPQPIGPQLQMSRSPYKAARQLNMVVSPGKPQRFVQPGEQNQGHWQQSTHPGQKIWENINVAPLPVLSSETLNLLSTLTVSTVSSPVQVSPSTVAADSQMPKSTLLQKHLMMPPTPIRNMKLDNLLVIADRSTVADASVNNNLAKPPSRSDSMKTARLTRSHLSEKKTTESATFSTSSTVATPTNVVTLMKTDVTATTKEMSASHEAGTERRSPVEQTDAHSMYKSADSCHDHTADSKNDASNVDPEIIKKRLQLCEIYRTRLQEKLDLYKEYLTELFFLRNGGNIMDYVQFKKRPSAKLLEYLKSKLPDIRAGADNPRKISQDSVNSGVDPASPASDASSTVGSKRSHSAGKGIRNRSVSHDDTEMKSSRQKASEKTGSKDRSRSRDESRNAEHRVAPQMKSLPVSDSHQVINDSPKNQSQLLKKLVKQGTPAQLDDSIGSQEEILERAKQEAVIQRKVVELRKQGLWTQRRLPKVQEPPRSKTHWDYLLEEMRWLAADFAQERKWKRAAARKLARAVTNFHKEQHDQERRAKREEQNRLRRIASTMAREIRVFWGNIGKVVEYKQRSLLDEKRQKALDMHLSYIVDQTEKYSDWLTKGLNKPAGSVGSDSPTSGLKQGSDDEFLPQGQSSDDEETIAVAEQALEKSEEEKEVSLLKKESELPFEELLSTLPPELIENIGKPLEEAKPSASSVTEQPTDEKPLAVAQSSDEDAVSSKPSSISLRRSARKRKMGSDDVQEDEEVKKVKVEEKDRDDKEFDVENEGSDASDDETTIAKEEEQHVDHGKEIADLQAESEMPLEDLMKMYSGAFDADEPPEADKDEEVESLPASPDAVKDESSSESEDEGVDDLPEEEEIGMDYLFKSDSTKDEAGPMIMPSGDEKTDPEAKDGSPSKEITDVAAEAASLQPTGFTLATTQVVTPIPVLLKHTLREYQHIGLDWLVTMYDKRLNGILADEMGLGKTIQTIALLAHLACDKGVWGPHLIVVPTSVMLNWEMEFKKWCPGFKILTYYGSQKERKAKRTGWTKSNAFHVCITSYKLVLQDNTSFRRKKWKYLILDEAQNIKNFKSQRWQTLLNFNSQRRLLLTGTPLQNNLMELWSLMHFLMPHVFQSHKEFKEWFSNPLTGMIEGGQEYNEKLVKRLHKVLRPFLLRRIKKDVEKQMPNKYEHVVRCHLSKRQRFLYDDFMSQASTKDTLQSGHFMSVINILMQLRKVCNHPNLFEPRAIVSPFFTDQMYHRVPSLVTKVSTKSPFETLNLQDYQMHLPSLTNIRQTHAELLKKIQTPRKLIEELPGDVDVALEREDSKVVGVREKLATLLKEREKVGKSQPANSLPVLTIPITSGTNSLQITPACGPARVITIPQSKTDDSVSKASQAFALQYQTVQGTRVAIPNKQIRQLAGGVVKIVTPSGTKSQASVSAVSANATQNGPSHSNSCEAENKGDCETLDIKDPTAYVERLEKELERDHRRRCLRMAAENERRCQATSPWLPQDTVDFLKNINKRADEVGSKRIGVRGSALFEMIKSADRRLNEMKPVTDRFTFVIPLVEAKPIDFHVSHPDPSQKVEDERRRDCLQVALKRSWNRFHSIDLSMRIQFPEARLIQYDCGKLQVLDVLLRRFWTEKHKCLIFTQMTKVLDILEAFLSYHGYRYLRLDGSTRVEQRMLLMERFNNDPKIFCFILSTRSGGIGVNLTGADTVIFYDSDWNPTMDAQAQDRCHRIGQTRDVHIYRLISERTVEENILKKANQKRLLGNIAIEGGSFTTAFFKDNALKDLFNEPTGLEEAPAAMEKKTEPTPAVLAKPITARQKALAAAKESEAKQAVDSQPPQKEASWEEVLQQTEDKEDVDAAKQLREEQDADMDEFTENADDETAEGSKIREEMKSIYEELTPIEKYALRFLEETTEEMNREELELAEEEVHKSKQDWELAHLVALKEEEERRLEEEEDEIFYTREDAENQVIDDTVKKGGKRRKRKKEKDICFWDMSSTSSEDGGLDVETLENETCSNDADVSVTVPKLKRPLMKSPKKKTTSARGRGRGRPGRGRYSNKNRPSPTEEISPSKRRRASHLMHDITMHGYSQNNEFLYYNDGGDDDSSCGEEAPWGDDIAWSDREDWPETPSEDNASSDDDTYDDRTVCILTDGTPEKQDLESPFWSSTVNCGASGRGQVRKVPFYNIVVETNVTPSKLLSKSSRAISPVAKPKTVESITQRVNKTMNFNAQSAAPVYRPLTQNVIPTISLRQNPRPPVPTVRHAVPGSVGIRPITVIPARSKPQALNVILQQQAAQRRKLQSYKIPLKTTPQSAMNALPNRKLRPYSGPHTGALQLLPSTAATVIQLSKFTSGIVNVSQVTSGSRPVVSMAGSKPVRIMPMPAPRQSVAQPVKTAIPIRIVSTNSLKSGHKAKLINVSSGSNPAPKKLVPKRTVVSNPRLVKPSVTTASVSGSKNDTGRGLFDLMNSVEFMVPPIDGPNDNLSASKGSLFDSLQQEFMGGGEPSVADDDDEMITLNLEPVSPSDPQLLDDEEERNVFESFQSLLQQ